MGCVLLEIPEEGWRTYWLKRYEYNNEDEDNCPETMNDRTVHIYKID